MLAALTDQDLSLTIPAQDKIGELFGSASVWAHVHTHG